MGWQVYPYLAEEDRPFERVQEAGEIVFLPSQWWHFIINLTDTIAVTENFVPEFGLQAAVQDLASGSGHSHIAQAVAESETQGMKITRLEASL